MKTRSLFETVSNRVAGAGYTHIRRLPTLCARRQAREAVGAHRGCPVVVVPGDQAPELDGESWCYRTKGGSYIRHPSAYGRKGFSNMVYHHSTLRVVVGRGWFA